MSWQDGFMDDYNQWLEEQSSRAPVVQLPRGLQNFAFPELPVKAKQIKIS